MTVKIEELDLSKNITMAGMKWCKKNQKEFSIRLGVSDKGCMLDLSFSNSDKMTNEQAEELIILISKTEEIQFLTNMFKELNELKLGFSEIEADVISKVQDRIEEKIKIIGKEHFPEIFTR